MDPQVAEVFLDILELIEESIDVQKGRECAQTFRERVALCHARVMTAAAQPKS